MRYETVIFDLDGTLVDSYEALQRSVNHTRARFGLGPLDIDRIKSMVGDGLGVLLERTFAPDAVPADAKQIFEAHYDSVCCEASSLLDGVDATVARLHAAGTRMAICTNKPTSFSLKIVEHLGLRRFMHAVVGPDAAGARKPDARHVHTTIERAGGHPESTLFVGDMKIDIEAARNAGVAVAAIPTGAVDAETLRGAHADYLLERFSDLEQIVLGESP
jgi:phosphoglycolate phosphatase